MRETFFGAMMAAFLGSAAFACPDPEPCATPDGLYHAVLPESGPVRGAILFLHGWGGRAAVSIANPRLVDPARARGYAVIAPQGLPRFAGDEGGAWNSTADPARRDDRAFLGAVLDDAAARLGLPRGRVLAAGFSGGGMMIWRLACDAPDAAAAYAPIAGLLWRPLPERCAGPVKLMHAHGWRDAVVPIEGRPVGGGALVQGDLFAGLDLWRAANGCAGDAPDSADAAGPFLRREWTGCAAGALSLVLFDDGHTLPEGWTDLALDWFERVAP